MFIHYANGSSREGAILSLEADCLRVAIAGVDDICEFVLRGRQWVSESLDIISFTFPPGPGWQEELTKVVKDPVRLPSSPHHRASRAIQ